MVVVLDVIVLLTNSTPMAVFLLNGYFWYFLFDFIFHNLTLIGLDFDFYLSCLSFISLNIINTFYEFWKTPSHHHFIAFVPPSFSFPFKAINFSFSVISSVTWIIAVSSNLFFSVCFDVCLWCWSFFLYCLLITSHPFIFKIEVLKIFFKLRP